MIAVGDWYNTEVIEKIRFFDDNTRQWWTPLTGGSNIPALNEVFSAYKMSFGDTVYDGTFRLGNDVGYFNSGNGISSFPK